MMINRIITFILLFPIFCINTYAEGDAFITVHAKNKEMAKQSLTLITVKDHIDYKLGSKEQLASADANGNFRFHVKGINNYEIIFIELGEYLFISNYIEAGDNIFIDFSGDGRSFPKANEFKFSGRGCSKLIARSKIYEKAPRFFKNISRTRQHDQLFLDSLVAATNDCYHFDLELLNTFRKQMSKTIFQQIQGDVYARAADFAQSYLGGSHQSSNGAGELNYFYAQLDKFKPDIPAAVISQSQQYIAYLTTRALKLVELRNANKIDRPLLICKELIRQNKGAVLEKTLMFYLCRHPSVTKSRDPEQVYALAMSYIQSSNNREYLLALSASRKSGSVAYNFDLPDANDRRIKLSQFRNKVVIIDCWFTGCSSCSGMAKQVEREVLPSFKNNPDVVFISICADKDRNMWLTSLREGKYTNPGSINLFTEGLGTSHPFMKKYNFQGFPRFILIGKNGRVFSSEMPRKSNEMIAVINEALKGL